MIRHNPPLPGLPAHALPALNHDRTDHNTKPMGHWCIATVVWTTYYVYDVITFPTNAESFIGVLIDILRRNFSRDFASLRLLLSFFAPKWWSWTIFYPLKIINNRGLLWIELRYLKNYITIKHICIFNSQEPHQCSINCVRLVLEHKNWPVLLFSANHQKLTYPLRFINNTINWIEIFEKLLYITKRHVYL